MLNCADIDALVAAIAAPMPDPAFDLTGDEMVDLADRDAWLAAAGAANLASGNSYLCVTKNRTAYRELGGFADNRRKLSRT